MILVWWGSAFATIALFIALHWFRYGRFLINIDFLPEILALLLSLNCYGDTLTSSNICWTWSEAVVELAEDWHENRLLNIGAWVAIRLSVALIPVQVIHILEAGTIGVREHWFYDFEFIKPWLWFSLPVGFVVTSWLFVHVFWFQTQIISDFSGSVCFCAISMLMVAITAPLTTVYFRIN